MKRTKMIFTLLIVGIGFISLYSQQLRTFKGIVVSAEDNEPLIGANIIVKNSKANAVTNSKGEFSIKLLPNENEITISYIGYISLVDNISDLNEKKFLLKENTRLIDEVVVIGYGVQKKKEVTGAVSSVSGENLNKIASGDFTSALQGQVAGVNVQAASGEPGSMANIQIRGISSVTGSNDPLYVIDGVPYEGVPTISPYEIAKIDILKDAASASVYGTRASNGVVLITTKEGVQGDIKINFNGFSGFQKITSGIKLASTEEYLLSRMIYHNQRGAGAYWPTVVTTLDGLNINTNWLDEFQVDNALIHDYNLRVSGGKPGISYNLTAGYFKQEGAMINSGYERGNIRQNILIKKNKLTLNSVIGGLVSRNQKFPGNLQFNALRLLPYQPAPPDNDDEIFYTGSSSSESNSSGYLGEVITSFRRRNIYSENRLDGNIRLEYQASKELKFNMIAGGYITNVTRRDFTPSLTLINASGETTNTFRSRLTNESNLTSRWNIEGGAVYNKVFNGHSVNVLANLSVEEYNQNIFSATKYDLISNETQVLDAATKDAEAEGSSVTSRMAGALSRIQYNYKSRYLFSASVRVDGSSKFLKQNHWGTFPSVMLGWNISEEPFWEKLSSVLPVTKLRTSYGSTGNNRFSDYSFATAMATGYNYLFGTGISEELAIGAIQTAFANPLVKWETTESYNIGFDLGLLNNALTLTGDMYYNNKRDMLFNIEVPPSTGTIGSDQLLTLNVGNMVNYGTELNITYKYVKRKFSFDTNLTFARNVNMVTSVSANNEIIYMGEVLAGTNPDKVTVIKKGYPAGSFFLIPTDGIIKTEEELEEYKNLDSSAKIGDLRYVDSNNDGEINNGDRTYHGSGAPEYEVGLGLNFKYRGFDLSTQWYASIGNKIINGSKAQAYQNGVHYDLINMWSLNNTESTIPVATGGDMSYRVWSDYFLEDGDFLRLKNISFGYTFPMIFSKRMKIDKLRLVLSAVNPVTLTRYSGFDPEIGNDGLKYKGIDRGTYPVSSQFRAGFEIIF